LDYFYTGQIKLAENFFETINLIIKSHYIIGDFFNIFLKNISIIKTENLYCLAITEKEEDLITCILCEEDLKSLNHAQICIIKETAHLNRCDDKEALKQFALSWIKSNAQDFRNDWDNSKR
jgi:hypothetical protein